MSAVSINFSYKFLDGEEGAGSGAEVVRSLVPEQKTM